MNVALLYVENEDFPIMILVVVGGFDWSVGFVWIMWGFVRVGRCFVRLLEAFVRIATRFVRLQTFCAVAAPFVRITYVSINLV